MPRKRHKAEEIVAKLRQVDVLVSQGKAVAEAVRAIEVTEVTYYRWRQEYGGLKGDQVKRLKDLEAENTRLRRAVSDLTLEKLILKEANGSGDGRGSRQKQPKRGRLCLNDGSCLRLRLERPNHVWSYDCIEDRTHDKRKICMLNVIDDSRENASRSASAAT